ncbi:hypothetical protein C9374_008109 [Naegleria lovaniensis]|uniref:Prolyl 4-hydroxylase alpha subunit domain-containing protein n=1 Tax=Naegleria lovaniensis TaxID=51637 RepID=A0AA88GKM4_NAELO|nr:uncharacterized protein C9374_008109 [Naegleria lovaniensis]KAG2378470.1 hypothetical protein C9374_008109 [Naegleria lovaniensis]
MTEPLTKTLCLSCTSGNDLDGSHSSLFVFDGMDGSVKYSILKGLNESKKGQSKVLDFNHIGMEYIMNSVSNCLNIWKLNNESKQYELLHQLDDHHQYDITCVKVIPGDVPLVATSGLDTHICVWNVESGKLMSKIGLPHLSPIKSMFEVFVVNQRIVILSISMDGSMVLSCCNMKEDSQWKETLIVTASNSGSSVLCASIISTSTPREFLCSISYQNRSIELYSMKLVPQSGDTYSLDFQLSQPFVLSLPSVANHMILTRNKLICSSRDCTVRMFLLSCTPNFDRVTSCDMVSQVDCVSSQCFSMALTSDQSILLLGLSDAAIYYLKFSPRYEWDYPRFELGKDDLLYDNNIHAYLKPPFEEFSIDHVKRPQEDLNRIKCVKFLDHIYKGRDETYLIHHLLSELECQHLIAMTEKLSYEDCYGYHKDYRSNKRVIVEDKITAQILFERAKPLIPQEYVDENGQIWDLKFANSRWRFCRYTPGQHFLAPHQDGFYEVDKNTRSFFTFMMYLNGGYEEGRTTFIQAKNKEGPPQPPFSEVGQVEPHAGLCIVFPHHLLHYGSVLKSGVKYLMRSELIYSRRRVQ